MLLTVSSHMLLPHVLASNVSISLHVCARRGAKARIEYKIDIIHSICFASEVKEGEE
jgi:hypothetical protein